MGDFRETLVFFVAIQFEFVLERLPHGIPRHPPVSIVGIGLKLRVHFGVDLLEAVSFLALTIFQGTGLFLLLDEPSDLRPRICRVQLDILPDEHLLFFRQSISTSSVVTETVQYLIDPGIRLLVGFE